MKVVLGCDHGGFEAKEALKIFLEAQHIDVVDVGTYSKDSCNYAEFGIKAAEMVSRNEVDFGVVICSSGEGIAIAANKVKGIRCGVGYNDEVAALLREHNDANMISFGAKFMTNDEIRKRSLIFLKTPFEGGRHCARVQTIIDREK